MIAGMHKVEVENNILSGVSKPNRKANSSQIKGFENILANLVLDANLFGIEKNTSLFTPEKKSKELTQSSSGNTFNAFYEMQPIDLTRLAETPKESEKNTIVIPHTGKSVIEESLTKENFGEIAGKLLNEKITNIGKKTILSNNSPTYLENDLNIEKQHHYSDGKHIFLSNKKDITEVKIRFAVYNPFKAINTLQRNSEPFELSKHFPSGNGIVNEKFSAISSKLNEQNSATLEGKAKMNKVEKQMDELGFRSKSENDDNKVQQSNNSKHEVGEKSSLKKSSQEKPEPDKWLASGNFQKYTEVGNVQTKEGRELQGATSKSVPVRITDIPSKVASIVANAVEFPLKAEIVVQPKWLGTVVVEINAVKDKVEIMFKAENPEALKAIESQIGMLKEKLQNLGFEKQNFTFQSQMEEKGNGYEMYNNRQGRHQDENLRRDFLRSFWHLRNQDINVGENIWGEDDKQY